MYMIVFLNITTIKQLLIRNITRSTSHVLKESLIKYANECTFYDNV